MPKKHNLFPPYFKAVSGICAAILTLIFAAWTINYFTSTLHLNFPMLTLTTILLFIVATTIIVIREYEEKQTLEDNYKALDKKYQSIEEKLSNPVEVNDGRLSVKASRNDLADPNFVKDVSSFVNNYDKLTESYKKELREKWKEEGRQEVENEIMNGKW